jgi:hypothetical protein
MRTLIQVDNANCTDCMTAVRDALLARPLVHAVRSSAVSGCWELDHDHDDLHAITDLVRQSLRGWEVADNGEVIMIATTPEVRDRCAWHGVDRDQG